MISPTKFIDSLWEKDFFKTKKETKNVRKLLSDEGLNPENITDLLKKRSYLKNKKGWIQKYPCQKKEEDIQLYYFESGKPRTSRKNFVKILNDLKGEIKICDPYFNKDTLEALEEMTSSPH